MVATRGKEAHVRDPDEGIGPDGTIVTGARRDRVPAAFEPVVAAAVDAFRATGGDPALHLYGSVATGRARIGESDVDLIVSGPGAAAAPAIGAHLSARFAHLCRGVEIGVAGAEQLAGDTDEAYGYLVFLRHYCVQLLGAPRTDPAVRFPADARAARGFDGDIARHAQRWQQTLDSGADPSAVARRAARKTLLAVAALVSVHDRTWTTDRVAAAHRWARIDPEAAAGLAELATRLGPQTPTSLRDAQQLLDGPVARMVEAFRTTIGLWPADP